MDIPTHLIKQLEEQLLDPTIRCNSELVASMLADNFIEFGSSGRIFNKASILEDLKNEPPRPASTLTDFANPRDLPHRHPCHLQSHQAKPRRRDHRPIPPQLPPQK